MDGWGEIENDNTQEENGSDNEGWDDVDPFDEKPPPSLLSNIQAAQKRPVAQPKQPGRLCFCYCICYIHIFAKRAENNAITFFYLFKFVNCSIKFVKIKSTKGAQTRRGSSMGFYSCSSTQKCIEVFRHQTFNVAQ